MPSGLGFSFASIHHNDDEDDNAKNERESRIKGKKLSQFAH